MGFVSDDGEAFARRRRQFAHCGKRKRKRLNGADHGMNNHSEQELRDPALPRRTGRTNKAVVGTRRQTILVSVWESLRLYLPDYTMKTVMEEIESWCKAGRSCITKLLKRMTLKASRESILDQVIPIPEG